MNFLSVRGLTKSFNGAPVVRQIDLGIERGEFVSLLGPSGCGKTTMLRMVAGFERPSEGRIAIDGQDVTDLAPNRRQIGMVFQAYALFPNMTVEENVAFGLRVSGTPRGAIKNRVGEMLDLVRLGALRGRYPYQLSGGQQQRVALARALAPKPRLLLLDEPLSALDAKIRVSLREEIRDLQRRLGITTIFVTHDQEEALSMSDRIVVMNEGRAEQIGTPFEIYNRPATRFVASFVGALGLLDGTIAGRGRVRVGAQEFAAPLDGEPAGAAVTLALRPEALSLRPEEGRSESLSAEVASVSFLGSVVRLRARIGDSELLVDTFNDPARAPPVPGDTVQLYFSPADLRRLDRPAAR